MAKSLLGDGSLSVSAVKPWEAYLEPEVVMLVFVSVVDDMRHF